MFGGVHSVNQSQNTENICLTIKLTELNCWWLACGDQTFKCLGFLSRLVLDVK